MKIALATDGKMVSEHFGHCEEFTIFDIKNNEIESKNIIANPGHKPGFLPQFLHEKEVNIVVSGGMGKKAIELFNENEINVITGAVGDVDDVIAKYLEGELVSDGSVCTEHEHSGDCGEH